MVGEWIHVDGKTLRGTRCQQRKLKALHVVSAWAGQSGLTLGQVAVAEKSKEITAIPELLTLLDLREKIGTSDAMGCQKTIAATIIQGGGDSIVFGTNLALVTTSHGKSSSSPAPSSNPNRIAQRTPGLRSYPGLRARRSAEVWAWRRAQLEAQVTARKVATPSGLGRRRDSQPRVGATLGWKTQSRWDCGWDRAQAVRERRALRESLRPPPPINLCAEHY